MRLVLVFAAMLMVGCQATKETDYSAKPKECDARAVDSGLCVPGEYDDSE